MKHYFIALALMLTLSASTMNAVPKHRHHPQTTAVATAPDSASEGIDAYSDTTSVADNDSAYNDADSTAADDYNPADYDDPFSYWAHTVGWGFGGILLAIVIVLLVFLFLLAPFIILALVLRYLIKRHNDKVTLAEKAMETGQPVPESVKPVDKQSDDYLWKRGIRNMAIGCGLMLMFWFWNAEALAGVGALVLCYGAGQAIMARTSANKKDKNNINEDIK